ncbi:tetratricopeptide repeat protein [Salinicoccus albus]|uniref:tetratricopeptide repeat protein n=1 Tax=Salinicoccus albus TaxID=418756 RepID=UPI0003799E95|nr:tetratricopeptide repeat protein [Salinicoccus albus]
MGLEYEKLMRDGKMEAAIEAIFNSIEAEPREEVHYINGANMLHKAGRDQEAENFLQKAITLNSGSTSAYYSLANIYFDSERYSEAVRLYLLAYSRNPEDGDLNFMLAMSHVHLDSPEKAIQFFEAAHNAKPDDLDISFQYGLLCCQVSLYDPAEKLLGKVIDKTDHADAEYNMGLLKLMKYDDQNAAIHHFRNASEIQNDHHLAHHALRKLTESNG